MLALIDNIQPFNLDQLTFTVETLECGPAWVWSLLLQLRDAGMVKLEALRNAGVKNPLDTEAVVFVPAGNKAAAQLVQTYLHELEDMLGVGYARMETYQGERLDIQVADTRDKYGRCARSWKRRPDVGSDSQYPDLSARDAAVVRELQG